jgi:hypothetical protein
MRARVSEDRCSASELPILVELEPAPGTAIQDGTEAEDNGVVTDPIVAALAQLVRDAYANEQRMRARFRVVGSSEPEVVSMAPEDERSPDEFAEEPAVPSDRPSHRPWLRLRRAGHLHGNCWDWSGREDFNPPRRVSSGVRTLPTSG